MPEIIIKFFSLCLIIFILSMHQAQAKSVNSNNFLLPKSFKINDAYLPPLETPTVSKQTVTVTTQKANTPVKTTKTNAVTTSDEVKKTTSAVNTVKTSTPKTVTLQTNPVKKTVAETKVGNNSSSLQYLVKSYAYSYANTLNATIISLSQTGITPVSCNTSKGQIIARLDSGKEIFILLVPYSEKLTSIRITPADGIYNLPMAIINQIFTAIEDNLITG